MKKKAILVLVLIFIGALAFGISRVVQNPEQYEKTEPEITTIAEVCSVSEDQAKTIWAILQDCGVGAIEAIEHDELLDGFDSPDELGYRITTKSGNHVMLYLTGTGEVSTIRHAGEVLYPKS